MESFVASDTLEGAAAGAMESIPDFTDSPGTVTLITVPFVASSGIDESTIPGNVVEFVAKVSPAQPTKITTPGPTNYALLWPDPSGGWTWVSQTGTYPVTVYGYRVDSDSPNFCGCKNIQPVVINAAGETLTIGEVSLPIADTIFTT